MNDQQPFQEKPNWKEKLTILFQKTKGDLSGLVQHGKQKFAAPSSSSGGSERTLTGMLKDQWKNKIQPKFSFRRGGSGSSGESGPRWDARKLNSLALLLAVLLVAWTGADLAAFFAEKWIPEPPVTRSRGGGGVDVSVKSLADYQVIINRNLFSSLGRIPGDEVPGTQQQNNEPVKTTLPMNLIGTVILKNELRSVATIEDKGDNQVYPVRVDDEIPGKIKILSIEPYKVIFRNLANGRREFVDMPEEGNGTRISVGSLSSRAPTKKGETGIEQVDQNNFNIAKTEIDRAMSNMNEILSQARAIPHFENGQPAGYKLIQIVPGSIYTKLGFKDGDIIRAANGESVTDPARALELMNNLKTASQMEITVTRDGRTSTKTYNFK